MAYILNIDTSIVSASIGVSKDDELLNMAVNKNQKDHAAWIQPAIKSLVASSDLSLNDIDAVAVSIGPGSYTGLRIGLSTAKGLCYALGIPLIAIGTLDMMAMAAEKKETDLICPMIDARRMEVFTALYKKDMQKVIAPSAILLDSNLFVDFLEHNTILFFGNGSNKLKYVMNHPHAIFDNIEINSSLLIKIENIRFHSSDFENLAYIEPMYIKNFYTLSR
jgi:tRNA threonylcarbamoyladenosine biosynthesis protein TsaB